MSGDVGAEVAARMDAVSDLAVTVAEDVWTEDEPTLAEYELTDRILTALTPLIAAREKTAAENAIREHAEAVAATMKEQFANLLKEQMDDYDERVMSMVADHVQAAKKDALREAADELNTTDHATETALGGVDYIIDWLKDRAESITPRRES